MHALHFACARRSAALLVAALALANHTRLQAHDYIAWNAAVTSDYVFRGISQNQSEPALQGGLTWTHPTGWYAGAWGSQVDFGAGYGADLEVDAFVGYRRALGEDWTVDAQLLRYLYPGTSPGVDLDFNELIAVASYRDRFKGTLAWSDDVFATGHAGTYLAANVMLPLPDGIVFDVGLGSYRFDDAVFAGPTDDYAFASLALSRGFGAFTAALALYRTDSGAEDLFGAPLAGNRWAFTLTGNF